MTEHRFGPVAAELTIGDIAFVLHDENALAVHVRVLDEIAREQVDVR